jgi:hypothetical protein
MSQIEYLIPLVSIIIGLGLADLVRSLRELIHPGRPVRWHWLPLIWTGFLFLMILRLWWTSFSALQQAAYGDVLAFLPYLLVFLGLYLACTFALPDLGPVDHGPSEETADTLDLEAFYFAPSRRRWFFGTVIAALATFEAVNVILFFSFDTAEIADLASRLLGPVLISLFLAVLIVTDRWWVHLIVSILLMSAVIATLIAGTEPLAG